MIMSDWEYLDKYGLQVSKSFLVVALVLFVVIYL